jgi:hypothetical protein
LNIAVIGEDGRLAEEARAQGNAGRIELGQVKLNDIVLPDEFCGNQTGTRMILTPSIVSSRGSDGS